MAAEAIVSVVLEQLTTSVFKEILKGVRLVAGVGSAIENLTKRLQSIQAVLKDAEEKQLTDELVSVWLNELKEASYDVDDLLDKWNTKMINLQMEGVRNASILKRKVCLFFLSPAYRFRRGILTCEFAFKIKEMNVRLDDIDKRKANYNLNVINSESIHKSLEPVRITSSFDVSDMYGRNQEKDNLVSKLLSESNKERKGLQIIPIVGMGGIGKTTLAQFVYNDQEIVRNFEERIWVCVSETFDQFRIAKAILEALTGNLPNLGELQALFKRIANSVEGKKILLVLDDVWTEDDNQWKPLYNCLNNGFCDSKILVTTRKETVARMMGAADIINIQELSEDICWSLFTSLAFSNRSVKGRENLEEVGRKIVGKCKGLPLAIKTIGSLLRFKKTREEWQRILSSETWDLEVFKEGIFPILRLSYNDLPYMIRRCFSYCAIFPKDYTIEKDELIKLWMANSYLGKEDMEVIGEEYFNYLAMRSFFQDFEVDDDGTIIRCKMHDIVHDFAQSLTKNECFTLEVYDSKEPIGIHSTYAKAHHCMVRLRIGASFSVSMLKVKKLRSLLIDNYRFQFPMNIQDKLFDELTCLRALSLIHTGIEMISRKIGQLIHLRYLNLSYCRELKELPATLCELYYLQTLDLTGCFSLKKLPQGMGKLINLRHLLNDYTSNLIYMPKGIERLTCLRTLTNFVVSGGVHGSTLDCLKNLNNLRGSLEVRNLGNVMNVDEVKKAQVFRNKEYLTDLTFGFLGSGGDDESRMNERRQEAVLESLQPSSNLEKLEIAFYQGKTLFPNWNMLLLTKLTTLEISCCDNCDRLPSLGKLPALEWLTIGFLKNVKRVSNEFLGMENDATIASFSSSSVVAFPKLKDLSFWDMPEWEEWDSKITKREGEEEDDFSRIMPCLRSLEIISCNKLKELPDYLFKITTLEKLIIRNSSILEERCREENGDYWKNMDHIPNIKIGSTVVKGDF